MAYNFAQGASRKDSGLQGRPIPGREQEMMENHCGCSVFKLDPWDILKRFLIIGTESSTYYTSAEVNVAENTSVLKQCLSEDGKRFVDTVVYISDQGIAPRNDPAIYAMALACTPAFSNHDTIAYAFQRLNEVCRTGSHLLTFVYFVDQLRGWGRSLRNGLSRVYLETSIEDLIYQTLKYKNRSNWTHRDILRKAHPVTKDPVRNELFASITKGNDYITEHPDLEIINIVHALPSYSEQKVVQCILEYNLTREMIPSQLLNSPAIWEALLHRMPMMAMIRNLGKMTSVGLLTVKSESTKKVVSRLVDVWAIKGSRIHPINIFNAYTIYRSGGSLSSATRLRSNAAPSWAPVAAITQCLEDAFYTSFKNVESSNKRISINLDVSGSMAGVEAGWTNTAGMPFLSPRVASAIMSMAVARSEGGYEFFAFSDGLRPLRITSDMPLSSVLNLTRQLPFGRTNCALPMIEAQKCKKAFDAFIIYTDNETNHAGSVRPSTALAQYRDSMGINAKLIVCAMTSTGFSIADPQDHNSLDLVGFDSSAPQVISNFLADRF